MYCQLLAWLGPIINLNCYRPPVQCFSGSLISINAPCWLRRYAACFPSTSASHMASTAVRFPTPQRVDGSTQRTSVEVTDPLLCPPELDLVTRVSRPCICLCTGGYWRLGALPRRSPCRVRYNTFTAWISLRRRRSLLLYSLVRVAGRAAGLHVPARVPRARRSGCSAVLPLHMPSHQRGWPASTVARLLCAPRVSAAKRPKPRCAAILAAMRMDG